MASQRRLTAFWIAFAAGALLALVRAAGAGVTDNLVSYWKLDETSGTAVQDTQNNNHGTLTNAILNQPGVVGGNLAYEFRGAGGTNNGGNDRVFIDNGFFLDDYTRVGVSAWINPDTLDGNVGHGGANGATGRAIIEGRGTRDSLAFQVGDEDDIYGFLRFANNSGTTLEVRTNNGPVVTGQWQHVAMTYEANDPANGGTMRLYVDGQQVAQGSHTNANKTLDTADNVNNLLIGIFANNAAGDGGLRNRFDGRIDDLGLWGGTGAPAIPGGKEIAAVHGLGKFVGVSLDDPGIDGVIAACDAGPGGSAAAGGKAWYYSGGLPGPQGATGGSVAGNNAYIVLDPKGNGVTLGGGPPPATPPDGVTGLAMWLKADNIVDGPEPANGANVGSWYDSSGSGNSPGNIGPVDPTRQEVTRAIPGGDRTFPVVRFVSGSNELLRAPDILSEAGSFSDFTIIAVYQTADLAGDTRPVGFGAYQELDTANNYNLGADPSIRMDNGNIGSGNYLADHPTDFFIRTSMMTTAGGGSVMEFFDAALALNSVEDYSVDTDDFYLGDLRRTGASAGTFDIAEVIVYDRVLTPAERQGVEAFLRGKYFGVPGEVIPEPATLALAGLGLAGLGGYVRRRRRA